MINIPLPSGSNMAIVLMQLKFKYENLFERFSKCIFAETARLQNEWIHETLSQDLSILTMCQGHWENLLREKQVQFSQSAKKVEKMFKHYIAHPSSHQ